MADSNARSSLPTPPTPAEGGAVPTAPAAAHPTITVCAAEYERLRAIDQRYRTLLQANTDAIYVLTPEGRFEALSPAFEKITGFPIARYLSQPFDDLVHPDDLPAVRQALEKVLATGECVCLEMRVRTSAGPYRFVEATSCGLHQNGQVVGAIGIARDITDRKASQIELRQARDAAEMANRAKDQFLAMLSHELRTPLTPIVPALAGLLADPMLPRHLHADLEIIQRNVELAARLIDDLLDLTRISRGKLRLETQPLDLHGLIHTAVGICQADLTAKQLRLHLELDAEEHQVQGDPARLQQILWNLLKNAAKFTPAGGTITVRTSCAIPPAPLPGKRARARPQILVSVSDTGVGIAADQLEAIFQPFRQADGPEALRRAGLGLGLYISRTLAQMHRGQLVARSAGLTHGASFELVLPLLLGAPLARSVHPEEPPAPGTPASLEILLVEDHTDTAQVLSRVLRLHGHRVHIAQSVAAALELSASRPFDLLISDIGLPDGTGLDLLAQLRAERRAMQAIALSGYGMEEDIQKSRAAGFVEHLTKPVNPEALEAAIQRLLSPPPT